MRSARFGWALAAAVILPAMYAPAQQAGMTAQQVMAKIEAATGAQPAANTVDTIKAGDDDTPVTGIITTFMDTFDVLQKAVALHANLVITHEPTFYNHEDNRDLLPGDPVTAQKLAYIRAHHLVVWRFHDTWHARKPDGILEGVVQELGWQSWQSPAPHVYVPAKPMTVAALAEFLRDKTHSHAVEVVGDTTMPVKGIGLLPGASGLQKQVALLSRPDVDVLVAGESAQWEGVAWTLDAAQQGRHKALILLGHEASEEAGMRWCAEWLRGVLPGMTITGVSAGEPWSALPQR